MESHESLWSDCGTTVGLKSPFAHIIKYLEKAVRALLIQLVLAGSIWIQ